MKILIKYSILAFILIVSGVFVFLITLDINQYKPALVQSISAMTGRELRIDGDLKLSPSLAPLISVYGITLANAPWSDSGLQLLSVGRVEARAALIPLLYGRFHIDEFILHDTKLSLETDATGRGNWLMGPETAPITDAAPTPTQDSSPVSLPAVSIGKIDIRNADIAYTDGSTGKTSRFIIDELSTGFSDWDSTVAFTLRANIDGYPVQLDGNLGSINLLLANNTYPVDIKGRLAGVFDIATSGTVTQPLDAVQIDADLNFSVNVDTLADLNQFGGSDLPAINPVSLSGNLKLADATALSINSLVIMIGQTSLTGQIAYQATETVPVITVQLQSDLIDLLPFTGKKEELPKPDYLFSRDPLPSLLLATVNLDLSLAAKQFKSTAAVMENLQLGVKLNEGDLQATLESNLAGGNLGGTLKLDTRNGQSMATTLDITGSGIQLGKLPHDSNKPWFTNGPTDIRISGNGQGLSVAEMAGSFTGRVLIKVGEATLPDSNVDLFGADLLMSVFNQLNPLAKRDKTTLLECAVINLQINDGISKIDRQIAMQTSRMSMAGSGEINFKSEQLNLGIKPYAREGIGVGIGNMAAFAKIGGTLAKPRAEIDTKGAVKAGLTAGAAVATAGLSLLAQGLYSKTTDDPAPCNTALGKVTPDQSQEAAADAPQEENKGGLINNVKSGFKKLFGN